MPPEEAGVPCRRDRSAERSGAEPESNRRNLHLDTSRRVYGGQGPHGVGGVVGRRT
jgi:hypothetical protein